MAKKSWGDPWNRFPPSAPIKVDGGLATGRARGPIADSWWSRRFVEILESYGLGSRLERGRRYARQGQILSLEISAGLLEAQVQGSQPKPYLVSITLAVPTDRQWGTIDAALASRVGLAAYLLAGELPTELEDVFIQAKAPLFPGRWSELTALCSCPDSMSPCKHIAAVLYLFADRLDDDPWLLLEWRGRTQPGVLAALGLQAIDAGTDDDLPPWWPLRPGEPLPVPAAYPRAAGGRAAEQDDFPDPPDAVLRRLEELAVHAWQAPAGEALALLYAGVLRRSVALDETSSADEPGDDD